MVPRVALACCLAACLAGCQSGPNTVGGAAAGAAIGAAIGAATGNNPRQRWQNAAIGAAIGGVIGGGIGAQFDRQDRQRQLEATYSAVRNGRPASWSDPAKGTAGYVEPAGYAQTYQDGARCTPVRYGEFVNGRQVNSGQIQACIDRNGELRV